MRKIMLPVLAVLFTASIAVPESNAAFLFWKKVIGRSKTEAGCLNNARANSLSNVRVTPSEVNGTSIDGRVYLAITCVQRNGGDRAIMIIAGVGDDSAWVSRMVDETAEQVRTAGVPD
jgi:hypothetical protein